MTNKTEIRKKRRRKPYEVTQMCQQLGSLAPWRIHVTRTECQDPNAIGSLGSFPVWEEHRVDSDLIESKYGGGRYHLRIHDRKGKYVGHSVIEVAYSDPKIYPKGKHSPKEQKTSSSPMGSSLLTGEQEKKNLESRVTKMEKTICEMKDAIKELQNLLTVTITQSKGGSSGGLKELMNLLKEIR